MRRFAPFTFVLAVLALAAPTPALAEEDPCAAWSLHGYRVGMTRQEAAVVRPMGEPGRIMRNAMANSGAEMTMRATAGPKGFSGSVYFDPSDAITAYVATTTERVSRADLESALRDRLGQPLSDDDAAKFWSTWGNSSSYGKIQETTWFSEECDSLVTLAEARFAGLSGGIIVVGIESLSSKVAGVENRRKAAGEMLD